MERLDKLLSNCTGISRSEIKKLVKSGRITVNGEAVCDCSVKIDAQTDTVCIDNKKTDIKKYVYIMLNKPKGVVSASEGRGETTVVDILPEEMKRPGLFPAGRLDRDTTGFVLITNDGDFAHKILSPKNHVKKTYIASLDKPLDDDGTEKIREGLTLKNGTAFLPAEVEKTNDKGTEIKIVICEGKYHQIKRMLSCVGCRVLTLKRVKMGGLSLDSALKEGEARYITDEELRLVSDKR